MRTKLKEGENLIIEVRKHWIVLLKPITAIACISFIFLNLNKYNLSGFKDILFKAGLCSMAACILYFIYVYLDRKYDIWAVTNQRVIDESGIITYKTKESPLEKINNIDVVQTLSGRIMGYGKVQIQTAATEGESWINFVENPVMLQDVIIKGRDSLKGKKELTKDENLLEGKNLTEDTIREPIKIQETKECPFCAETILKKAKICRFCGRDMPEEGLPRRGVSAKELLAEETLTKKAPIVEIIEADLTSEKIPITDTPQAENITAEETLSYHNPHLWKQTAKKNTEKTE